MIPIATKEHTDSKVGTKLWFYVANSSDELTSDLLEIIDITPSGDPILCILDFGNQTKYVCEEKEIDDKKLASFVSSYKEDLLTGEELNL